ncbi:MAG: SH3 domain-containing protein [Lutibacter sp.]
MENQISCPHCKSELTFKKGENGKIVGTLVGGGIGYGLASGLGIAGAIAGAAIAMPATIIGVVVLALLGNKFGQDFDNNQYKCPECKNKLVL